MKPCLKCGRLFASKGPGNRVCGKCNQKNIASHRHRENYTVVKVAKEAK